MKITHAWQSTPRPIRIVIDTDEEELDRIFVALGSKSVEQEKRFYECEATAWFLAQLYQELREALCD